MNMSQISSSTVGRHLGYFQIFSTMSKAANASIHLKEPLQSRYLEKKLGNDWVTGYVHLQIYYIMPNSFSN